MTGDRAVLSVDLELFSHTPAYREASGTLDDPSVGLKGVHHLLDSFDDRGVEATFFVVAEVAESHPSVVERIAESGHEVASHTHTHRRLSTLSAADRREELERSRRTLERVAGDEVSGFRAPVFDVTSDHFASLRRAGYRYDSSVLPARHVPGFYAGEWSAMRPCSTADLQPGAPADLRELPVAVMPGLRLPLTGAWLRFFGVHYTLLGMRLLARREIAPVLYVHPWELVELPDVEGVPERVTVRTGAWMRSAVDRILDQPFEFTTARSAVGG